MTGLAKSIIQEGSIFHHIFKGPLSRAGLLEALGKKYIPSGVQVKVGGEEA